MFYFGTSFSNWKFNPYRFHRSTLQRFSPRHYPKSWSTLSCKATVLVFLKKPLEHTFSELKIKPSLSWRAILKYPSMNAWNRHSSQMVHPEAILGLRIFPFSFNIELFVTSLWTRWPFSRFKKLYLGELISSVYRTFDATAGITKSDSQKARRKSSYRRTLICYQKGLYFLLSLISHCVQTQ